MRSRGRHGRAAGPPTAANSFSKHEGIVKAKRGNGVVFSESAFGADPGRVWKLTDRKSGVRGEVLAEGDFSKMSRPDNLRYDRKGNLLIFEDNGSSLGDTKPAGPNNEVYVLPKGTKGSENLRKFATVRGGGEGTGPWFSRNGKILYLSIQDQAAARRHRQPRAGHPRPEGARPQDTSSQAAAASGAARSPRGCTATPLEPEPGRHRLELGARARPPSPAARRARRARPARAARPPARSALRSTRATSRSPSRNGST